MLSAQVGRIRWVAAVGLLVGVLAVGVSCESAPRKQQESTEAKGRTAPSETEGSRGDAANRPDRIIVLLGDGMGTAAISGASYASDAPLEMASMDEFNYVTTHSHEFVTTDSAASATAYATGSKTHYEGVSVKPGTGKEEETNPEFHFETVLERAEQRGWKTGLVSTVRIVHASPASFGAHRAHRKSYGPIAADLVDSGVDVLLGGGRKYFTNRSDGRNLLEQMEGAGFERATTAEEFRSATKVADRLVGLFAKGDPPPVRSGRRTVGLAESTRGAISVLDRNNDDGFFLMVEGAQIDWRGHGLDGPGTIASTEHFDRAVGAALEYARGRDDTLVVVVSDHETGGLTIMDGSQRERLRETLGGADAIERQVSYQAADDPPEDVPAVMPEMEISDGEQADEKMVPVFGHLSVASRQYAENPSEFWSIHTPEFVPMFAEGPRAKYVAEAGDNAEVGKRLEELVRGERSTRTNEGSRDEPSSRDEPPRNVVLFVGDGVGLDALTAAYYADGKLSVRSRSHQGMAAARGVDSLVQDDAAAATALATGDRTRNGALSIASGEEGASKRLQTILERAEAAGYRTGVVTTDRLTSATTAAMYAHGGEGLEEADVAASFADLSARVKGSDGIDVAYGGGQSAFGSKMRERLAQRGIDVGTAWKGGGDVGRQVVRVLADGAMAPATARQEDGPAGENPTLKEMTKAAIDHLQAWDDRFFLLVEAGGPGRLQGEADRSSRLVDEVVEFDEAIGAGLKFAERDGSTLVVATADADQTLSVFDNHYGFADGVCGVASRCGGPLELKPIEVATGEISNAGGFGSKSLQGEHAPPRLFLQYAWPIQEGAGRGAAGMNSANFVPVFASGPWADRFEGMIDQTAIGEVLKKSVGAGR